MMRGLRVQKAYDVLSDQSKRRAFDSIFDFDDSIPSGMEEGDFYTIYAPVFRRNARFSLVQPVPLLGSANSPDEVSSFYDFWHIPIMARFSMDVEHSPDNADSRDERRWMEKQNKNLLSKLKKAENKRERSGRSCIQERPSRSGTFSQAEGGREEGEESKGSSRGRRRRRKAKRKRPQGRRLRQQSRKVRQEEEAARKETQAERKALKKLRRKLMVAASDGRG